MGLSNPNKEEFRSLCDVEPHQHKHEHKCLRCEMVKITLEEVKDLVNTKQEEARNSNDVMKTQKMEDRLYDTNSAIEKIWTWKNHIIRSVWSDKIRKEILPMLTSTIALIIMDFAQNFLPTKHHESQSDYFGKAGLVWHLSHTITNIDGRYAQHTFIHFMETSDKVITSLITLAVLNF